MDGPVDPRLAWVGQELDALERQGLRRQLATRAGPQGPRVVHDGRPCINFGSNDYLALAADPRLIAAAAAALQEEGVGSGASPLVTGHAASHRQLDTRLAEFEGTEAALLFPSGFAANLGTIAALVGPGDAVFSDANNHASLWDGCRLSRADVRVYPHADWQELDRLLSAATETLSQNPGCRVGQARASERGPTVSSRNGGPSCFALGPPYKPSDSSGRGSKYRRRLIVTDGLFSMDGDLAPLAELADVAQRHGAMLMVDEAHATGVFGGRGRGVAEHLGVEHRTTVRIGTLSKALGCVGGFAAGSRLVIEWLLNRARPFIYSTAGPAAVAAAARAALEIVAAEPQRRAELLARAETLRRTLADRGWRVGHSASQIIPIVVGRPDRAVELSARLRERGLLVPAIRPPTVPEGGARLRISLTWGHTPEMIAALVEALGDGP